MKKLTAMMLVLACFIALTGCKPAQPGSTTAPATAAPTTAVPQTIAAPPTTVPPTTAPDPATFTEVWEVSYHGDFDHPYLPSVNGVRLGKELDAAMKTFSAPNYVFPLSVNIGPEDATKEEIYEAIFKPFITYEELKEDGNLFEVFLTAEQIAALKCPNGFSASIHLKFWESKLIWEGNIDEITTPTKHVKVEYECASGNTREENEMLGQKAADEIIADYGIAEEMISFIAVYGAYFEADLDKETIARLLDDPRIKWISDIDYQESDYVLVDRGTGSLEYFYE